MRNDVKPVIPPATPSGPAVRRTTGGSGGAAFDAEHNDPRRRERGDDTDPVGPKQSTFYGAMGTGGAVTDPSGTTGPTSRSNDRMSTTTGKLRDRDLERSARQGEAPDVRVLNIPTGDSSLSVPVIMAIFAVVIAVLGAILWFSWPSSTDADSGPDAPRAGDTLRDESATQD